MALAPVGDHGLLGFGSLDVERVSETDRYLVDIFVANLEAALDRVTRERTLLDLHETTREMMQTTDREVICERAVAAARSLLDMPVNAIWLADETGGVLRPEAWTREAAALLGEVETYTGGGGHAVWDVFQVGERRVIDDTRLDPEEHDEDTPIRSEVLVPIGDYGVLGVGSTEPADFDEGDVLLARMLSANTAAALERAVRERELRTRTDQMEFFNSILRHDVLNGMTVIRGRAALLAEDDALAEAQRENAETIVNWSDDVTDVVTRVRTVLDTLTRDEDRVLEPVDLSTVVSEECRRVAETYPDVELETDVAPDVAVLADELLSEVVGNLVFNAVEHNDPAELCVRTSLEERDGMAVPRVADDGAGVPDDRKEAIFRRGETGHVKSTGSGFGLFFVDAMVDAYSGDVSVEDNEAGGATFVLELPTAEPVSAER